MTSALPLVFPVLIWAILLGFVVAVLFALEDGVKRLRRLHQIPCDRCLYHTGCSFLRCPVQPLAAFSEAAIGCRDFEPVQGRLQPQVAQPIRPKRAGARHQSAPLKDPLSQPYL